MAHRKSGEKIDGDKLGEFSRTVFGAFGGAMTSAMIHLGDRLGLFRALSEVDAADSNELAARTGLSERWLREWLHQQGAAGVLEHRGEGRFALSPEGVAVLSDEDQKVVDAIRGQDKLLRVDIEGDASAVLDKAKVDLAQWNKTLDEKYPGKR